MIFDIIVPIYNAYEKTRDCLTSLAKYQGKNNNIILINDASTDERIKPLVNEFALRNNWQFIHQQSNKGFVKTANRGLKFSTNHTILLNSDTLVTKPWLNAFKQVIEKNKTLGTATPWSNNAEICSFPKFLTNQEQPNNPNKFAKILFDDCQPQYPILPTAVGFCMLITSQAKELVGYFDEEHFGHGYGEENDYSLRIIQAGLVNVLCDNAYIVHIGNQSFSDLGMQPSAQTMQRLLQKHPGYLTTIQEYIKSDPLSNIRENILSIIKNKDTGL